MVAAVLRYEMYRIQFCDEGLSVTCGSTMVGMIQFPPLIKLTATEIVLDSSVHTNTLYVLCL
jgi:hypothetical protein